MAIKITWTNPEEVETINLYRSQEKFDINSLPSVFKSFTNNETEWVDRDVLRNELYYYMIEKVDGDDISYTPLMTRTYFPESGPGTQEITLGDWKIGYFGEVEDREFFTSSELLVEINNKVDGEFYYPNNNSADWRKFIFNGKVLFIPVNGVTVSPFKFSWDFLYRKGLVYGIDGVGYHPEEEVEVNQEVIVTKNGMSYLVRLLRLSDIEQGLQHTEMLSGVGSDERYVNGEAANTWFRLFNKRANDWFQTRVSNVTYTNNQRTLFMELSENDSANIDANTTTGFANITTTPYTTEHTLPWIPVLELMIEPT